MSNSSSIASPEDLRLIVRSAEDLEVLSTLLQDAIIPGEDMVFDRESGSFIIVANRFCWDLPVTPDLQTEAGGPVYQRRLCGVQFRGVTRVQKARIPADRNATFFNLLAITLMETKQSEDTDGGITLRLTFSAGASIQISSRSLNVLAEDFSTPQPTGNKPLHDLGVRPIERGD